MLSRRALFQGAAGLAGVAALSPEAVFAASTAPWTLGLRDLETDVPTQRLRLVHGRAPTGLSGALYRNGPAKFRRPGTQGVAHWFDGDGLIRAFRIDDGRATLQARFADTAKRRADAKAGALVTPGFGTAGSPEAVVGSADDTNAANTAVLMAGGELWALWEAGSPTRLDPRTLESGGLVSLSDDLRGMPFLAHPRREASGRVWNLGLSGRQAMVYRLSADGALEAATPIKLPRASYLHDFTATERHLVIVLQPWMQDRLAMPFVTSLSWRPEQGTQVLVLDKTDLTQSRLYELPSFGFFHLGDAWAEADGTIRFDACVTDDPSFGAKGAIDLVAGRVPAARPAELALVTLRADGKAGLERLGVVAEFPRSDPRCAGLPRELSIHVAGEQDGRPLAQGVAVRNWRTGRSDAYDFGPEHLVEEMVYVPRPGGTSERDGWLVGPSVNLRAQATELHVFDVGRVSAGPVCTWRADLALPVSFHGVFQSA